MLHELQTALYAPRHGGISLLPEQCPDCIPGSGPLCDRDWHLSPDGYSTRAEDPSAVASWPACPWRWAVLREHGQDALPIDRVIASAHERGVHRDPLLGAGGHRLIDTWLRWRETPAVLAERRHRKDEERKRRLRGLR